MTPDIARLVEGVQALAATHGVRCRQPECLIGSTNLLVHLRPAPVVARLLTRTAWLGGDAVEMAAREVAVARHVTARGGGVVPLSDELPPGPHDLSGIAVTFWRFIPPRAGRPSVTEALAALAAFHAALDDCVIQLPFMSAIVGELPLVLDVLERRGVASPARIALLRLVHRRLMSQLDELPDPRLPIHGDAHVDNLLASGCRFLWTDLEHCSRGPRGWDVAFLAHGRRDRDALFDAAGVPRDHARLFEQLRTLQLSLPRTLGAADPRPHA